MVTDNRMRFSLTERYIHDHPCHILTTGHLTRSTNIQVFILKLDVKIGTLETHKTSYGNCTHTRNLRDKRFRLYTTS